jgi:hypothetical protein
VAQNDKRENTGLGVAEVRLSGTVEMIIPSGSSAEREKIQIRIKRGDDIYGVIRIENTLLDADGKPVALKNGAEVEITITSQPSLAARA